MYTRLLVLVILVVFSSCAPREVRLCERECDCEGCSESDFDDCLDDRDDDYFEADRRDCLPELRDFEACEAATWICDGDDWETDCGPERQRLRRCLD